MKRQNISSGATWEDTIGYSRAVRMGNVAEVSRLIKPEQLAEIEATAILNDEDNLINLTATPYDEV